MLKINMETSINNINFIRYMESKQQTIVDGGKQKRHLEIERATPKEKNKTQI